MSMQSSETYVFDARGVAKRFRHAAIFGALEALNHGETMRFVNDHDPLPLLAQIQQRYGEQIQAHYQQRDAGQVVIDFAVRIPDAAPASRCGGGGHGCGCSGG